MINSLSAKKNLTAQELSILNSEYQKLKKGSTPLWLLWLFFGSIGGHRYYLGDVGQGIFHTCMVVLACVLARLWNSYVAETTSSIADMMIYSSAGIFFFAIPLFFALIDAFFIGRRLKKKNEAIEAKIIDQIRDMRASIFPTAPPAP